MLDIKFIRENPDIVKKDLKKRFVQTQVRFVDDLLKYDAEWRKLKPKLDELRHRRNVLSEEVNKLKKQNQPIERQIKEVKEIPHKIKEIESKMDLLEEKMAYIVARLPNITHKSVPTGKDENNNKTIRIWGKKTKKPKSHVDLLASLDIADIEAAAKVSGARFFYLKNELVLLDLALQRFALDLLAKKGFTLIEPPAMLEKRPYEGVTDMVDFHDMLYKIEGEDLYLIATSEHPLAAMHMNKTLSNLPLKYAGVSPCFRKEAGAHGKDTKGIFRVHQFNKVEQFIFCEPKDSWKLFDELLKNAEEIMKKLKIPYRVVNIASGALNDVAAKKCDIEAWFPVQKKYREVVSCSNCTDFQARSLNIRYLEKDKKEFVHTLNSTAIATGRVMAAILENFQQKNGTINIPTVLHKYTGFKKIGVKK